MRAPEALYLCEQLNKTVKGKRITNVFTLFTPHKFALVFRKSRRVCRMADRKSIDHARSQGGMVEMTIGDKMLILTDGVNLRYYAPGTKLPAKHQLLIGFEDESCLIASVRMYGGIMWLQQGRRQRRTFRNITGQRKASRRSCRTLSAKEYFLGLINDESAQKKSAKAFLATEQTVPGLGNGVLQDILYHAHIHPKKKIAALTDKEKEKFVLSSKGDHERYLPAGWTKHGIGPVWRERQVHSLPL